MADHPALRRFGELAAELQSKLATEPSLDEKFRRATELQQQTAELQNRLTGFQQQIANNPAAHRFAEQAAELQRRLATDPSFRSILEQPRELQRQGAALQKQLAALQRQFGDGAALSSLAAQTETLRLSIARLSDQDGREQE